MTSFLNSIIEIHKIFEFQKKLQKYDWLIVKKIEKQVVMNNVIMIRTYTYMYYLYSFVHVLHLEQWILSISKHISPEKKNFVRKHSHEM